MCSHSEQHSPLWILFTEDTSHIREGTDLTVRFGPFEKRRLDLPILARTFAQTIIDPVSIPKMIWARLVRRHLLGKKVCLSANRLKPLHLLSQLVFTLPLVLKFEDLSLEKRKAPTGLTFANKASRLIQLD